MADDALEFDVLTTQGTRVIASTTQNSDLFFALRGGVSNLFHILLGILLMLTRFHCRVEEPTVSFGP